MLSKIINPVKSFFKNISIVNRITIFYTLFFTVLTMTLLSAIYMVTNNYVVSEQETHLRYVTVDVLEDYEEGEAFLEQEDGVFLSMYNRDGQFLQGSTPFMIENDRFQNNFIREIQTETGTFLYIDFYSETKQIWVRGSVSMTNGIAYIHHLLQIILIVLPIVVVIVLIVGYLIIKHAFKPVEKVIQTMTSIKDDMDLSKRVPLPEGHDEVHRLATIFNDMIHVVENSYEQKKRFTADVSHELRTPLSVILASSQLGQLENNIDEAHQSFEMIERQSKQMAQLVDYLLEMDRLTLLEQVTYDDAHLSAFLTQKVADFSILAHSKNVTLIQDTDDNVSYPFNKALFNRLIDNLLMNALKYTKNEIHVSLVESETDIKLSVTDNGCGIEKEHIPYLFDVFYQVDQARQKTDQASYGLGLSFVKRIVELHQGVIHVESEVDQFTTFEIRFLKKFI